MSTAQEIEDAIRTLPKEEREKLISDLPNIFPELSVSEEWDEIINDPRPRPALSALGDAISAQILQNSNVYAEIKDCDFDGNK